MRLAQGVYYQMTKAIIYTDEKSTAVFCIDGRIYFKGNNSRHYVEARDMLKSLSLINTKPIKEKKAFVEKLLTMYYKDAARLHMANQMPEDGVTFKRNGKLNEGEFND